MLLGKLYAMLIYGVKGSEGRVIPFAWRQLLTVLFIFWALLTVVSVVDLIEEASVIEALLAVICIAIMPIFIILIRGWGKKKLEKEKG